ncbi:hypothetical protein [Actinomycetospora sp. NBRC 106378]|uniref:hypothetical protein n=1 Tax=Actinomycetospora sp. NBRC 106378 TaxID=3032208 RepID=UPI0024A00D08|nr:hypothetical protein [Actinomycetospora sp. NBRC 106378]GLZ50612.1 hypothetical protein Acsp07_02290 [Actinomycetospora sp. NBRC 106378]
MPPFGRRSFLAAGAVLTAGAGGCARPVTEAYDDGPAWGWTRQVGPLQLGVTHTEYSLAPSDPPEALARGRAVLAAAGPGNQHLMGWGALNPEPAPGRDDFSSLDPRMALGTSVLTIAAAPDWMKGGAPGTTDFSRIEVAPRPEHHDDLAALAARAVLRYPQVRTVLVWNELKGFFDEARNAWDVVAYTDLCDRVTAAVKAARPEVVVGGPYAPVDLWASAEVAPSDVRGPWGVADGRALAAVEYWLDRQRGADLVVVDGRTATRDRGVVTDPVAAVESFAAVTRWLRARTDLPVWWAEFYPEPVGSASDADDPTGAPRAAVTLAAVAALARAGAAGALLWQPQAAPAFPYAALWTDTADPDGGRSGALTAPWTWLVPRLAAGTVDLGRSPDGRVLGFRGLDGVLLVNLGAAPVEVGGTSLPSFGAAVR